LLDLQEIVMAKEIRVPAWVTKGYYEGDPGGLRLAIRRYREPHSTEAERADVAAYVAGETFPCTSCGRFAFARPRACYWCVRPLIQEPSCSSESSVSSRASSSAISSRATKSTGSGITKPADPRLLELF
jgi:hypothetical protein